MRFIICTFTCALKNWMLVEKKRFLVFWFSCSLSLFILLLVWLFLKMNLISGRAIKWEVCANGQKNRKKFYDLEIRWNVHHGQNECFCIHNTRISIQKKATNTLTQTHSALEMKFFNRTQKKRTRWIRKWEQKAYSQLVHFKIRIPLNSQHTWNFFSFLWWNTTTVWYIQCRHTHVRACFFRIVCCFFFFVRLFVVMLA